MKAEQDKSEQKKHKQSIEIGHNWVSMKIISEQTDDDKQFTLSQIDKSEDGELEKILEEDGRQRQEFLNSKTFDQFTEMIVIGLIRRDFQQEMHFWGHVKQIESALYKGIKNILLQKGIIESKDHFFLVRNRVLIKFQQSYHKKIRVFYQDIQIGYITSTGQLKAISYIYAHDSLRDILNRQSIQLNLKKIEMKIFSFFSTVGGYQFTPRSISNQISPKISANSINYQQEQKEQMIKQSNTDLTLSDQKKKFIQLNQSNLWAKQAFIRNQKFQNDFLIIKQLNQDDTKQGISIFFVYRPVDDQIYAIKQVLYFIKYLLKSSLSSKSLSFNDVFSTLTLGQMTSDQRKIREAKILAKLNHPNILRLYDWWIEEDTFGGYALFMQTEYCSYPGLKNQTHDLLYFAYYYLNPLPNKEKLDMIKNIMNQIIDALEYLHKRGIVHRDLKPENILVTITLHGNLQVVLADFDQGKDVRETKLSMKSDEKMSEGELNSIRSQNTIHSGTSGYQTCNFNKDKSYDLSDEFYALGVTLLHLILTFPGEPKNRNNYTGTFGMSEIEDVINIFDIWANKFVKNKHKEFIFEAFISQLEFAKKLLNKKIINHRQIKYIVNNW